MIGITSYGGYIPRLRLNRTSIFQNIGWLAPVIVMVAQGERSFCNWDEDSVTMAVAASRDCLIGMDKTGVDALYLASPPTRKDAPIWTCTARTLAGRQPSLWPRGSARASTSCA